MERTRFLPKPPFLEEKSPVRETEHSIKQNLESVFKRIFWGILRMKIFIVNDKFGLRHPGSSLLRYVFHCHFEMLMPRNFGQKASVLLSGCFYIEKRDFYHILLLGLTLPWVDWGWSVDFITILPFSEGHQCSNEVPGAFIQGLHAQFYATLWLWPVAQPLLLHQRHYKVLSPWRIIDHLVVGFVWRSDWSMVGVSQPHSLLEHCSAVCQLYARVTGNLTHIPVRDVGSMSHIGFLCSPLMYQDTRELPLTVSRPLRLCEFSLIPRTL